MSVKHDFNSLVWLTNLVAQKRARIADLLRRLTCAESHRKSPVFRKFLDLMEQIAGERAQEEQLINRIEDIEERHRQLRAKRELEEADPAYDPEETCAKPRAKKSLWAFFAFLHTPDTNCFSK